MTLRPCLLLLVLGAGCAPKPAMQIPMGRVPAPALAPLPPTAQDSQTPEAQAALAQLDARAARLRARAQQLRRRPVAAP